MQKRVDISSNGLFFYEVTLFAFIAILGAVEKLRFSEWDSFCSKQLKHFSFKYIFSIIPVFLVLFFYYGNLIKSIAFSLIIPLILSTYKTSSRRKEQRKIEDLFSTILIIPIYLFIVGLIIGQDFSFGVSISAGISFLIAIAVGVLFGLGSQAIQRQHILIMLTFATATFIIADSLTNLGLVSVICLILFYYNVGPKKQIKQDILLYFFKGLITASLVFLVKDNFSYVAIIIAALIVFIKVIFGHKHFSFSLVPLAVAIGLDKIFYETYNYINIVGQITFFIAFASLIFNFKDIFYKIKRLVLLK